MDQNLVCVCYEGSSGASDIRTCYIDDILHFSLKDVLVTLNKENRVLGEDNPTKHIPSIMKSVISDLDDDEYANYMDYSGIVSPEDGLFITQPGLNRVMGNDKSKAGRKFQRWLYHEVVPSLTKHGVYPPPVTMQGSALSQMAEIVAHNARAIADNIIRQEKIEREILTVKDNIEDFSERLGRLENGTADSAHMLTINNWFENSGLVLAKEKEIEMIAWCENLSLHRCKSMIPCHNSERNGTKFHAEIIKEAKDLVERSKG